MLGQAQIEFGHLHVSQWRHGFLPDRQAIPQVHGQLHPLGRTEFEEEGQVVHGAPRIRGH
jgi:hypothetical protein